MNIPLQCRCGKVRGEALDSSAKTGTRAVCYCDDCQAFTKFLERPDVLDGSGGTDIFQMASWRLRITQGEEEVRCMRLMEKGMVRFYAGCCRTPIGNTLGPGVPFIGLYAAFMDPAARETALGAPIHFCMSRFATGPTPPGAHPKVSFGLLARSVRLMLGWWIGGRGKSSPLFDATTGAPRSAPTLLTPAQRDALR